MIGADTQKAAVDLKADIWNAATVTAVIQAKQEKRNLKDRSLNCFVLETHNDKNNSNEVDTFFKQLQGSIEKGNFQEGGRFQVAVQTGAHWTGFDISIKDNKLHVVSIDSAGDPAESKTLDTIKHNCPGTSIYAICGDVQSDNNSCSRFALDNLFKMQNLEEPIALLEANAVKTKPRKMLSFEKTDGPEFRLKSKDVPKEMSFVFRNTQSWTNLNALPEELKQSPINKKNTSLIQYAEGGSVVQDFKGQPKKMAKAIDNVKHQMQSYTDSYLDKTSDAQFSQALSNKTGLDYISKNKANRDVADKNQTSQIDPLIRMQRVAEELVSNTEAKKPEPTLFSRFKAKSSEEKLATIAKKEVIPDLTQGKVTPKTLRKFEQIFPEKSSLTEEAKNRSQNNQQPAPAITSLRSLRDSQEKKPYIARDTSPEVPQEQTKKNKNK